MPTTLTIQGIDCEIPDPPKKIEGQHRKPKDQYFRRTEIPKFMDTVGLDEDWNLVNIISESGITHKLPLTNDQEKFINQEIDRCLNGHWFMNKGVATYIPKRFYYFLHYWTTEDGVGYSSKDRKIEYRGPDRTFHIFEETCSDDPVIKGILRGKKVREGATTHGACISAHTAAFYSDQNCGTLSDTGPNAKNTFTRMITRGFFDSPVWLQPRYDNSTNTKGKLAFVKPTYKQKGEVFHTKREGNNSEISWERTTLAAYVNARISYMLIDESGRWQEVDLYEYWNTTLKQRLSRGASKIGFAYFPTAVNPPNAGGRNFSKLWTRSNQMGSGKETSSGLVRYFVPAWEGFSGFVDRYGFSVIEPPDEETLKFLIEVQERLPKKERISVDDLKLGAKKYLEKERAKVANDAEALSGHKRNFPFVEADMFDFGDLYVPWNTEKIKRQIEHLQDNPHEAYWRRGRLVPYAYAADGRPQMNIQWHDDSGGAWLIKEFPKQPNAFTVDDYRICRPSATHLYGGGMDTYRFDKTKDLGSKATIWIGSKMDVSKPVGEDGGDPVAFYIGRPKLTELLWKEMLMAELWYGCTITVERDATQEYIKYHKNTMPNFMDANCLPMLGKKPDIAIDPHRNTRKTDTVEHGAASSDPFVFSKQIEIGVIYIERYCYKIKLPLLLDELLQFDVSDRTSSDTVMGFLMMLLNITGDFRQRKEAKKDMPAIIEEYTIGAGGHIVYGKVF